MSLILSIYPNTLGFGYALLEMPEKLYDFGMIKVRPANNEKAIERIKKLMRICRPAIILIRDNSGTSERGRRVRELISLIEDLGYDNEVEIYRYTRMQIKETFEVFGATNKREIIDKLIPWFEDLKNRVPPIKKPWEREDYYMGIFDSLALAVTHQHLTE